MRTKIKNSLINLAYNIKDKGLYKTIQEYLYGNKKNVAPNECRW